MLHLGITSHGNKAKLAVQEEQATVDTKTRPSNAGQSYSPYVLSSAFQLDFYNIYREAVEKRKEEEKGKHVSFANNS